MYSNATHSSCAELVGEVLALQRLHTCLASAFQGATQLTVLSKPSRWTCPPAGLHLPSTISTYSPVPPVISAAGILCCQHVDGHKPLHHQPSRSRSTGRRQKHHTRPPSPAHNQTSTLRSAPTELSPSWAANALSTWRLRCPTCRSYGRCSCLCAMRQTLVQKLRPPPPPGAPSRTSGSVGVPLQLCAQRAAAPGQQRGSEPPLPPPPSPPPPPPPPPTSPPPCFLPPLGRPTMRN